VNGTQLERLVTFLPAYDKRAPSPSKDYGIHGVELRMVVKGPKGATQFVLYTNWQLPHVTKEFDHRSDHIFCHPDPADLGYHAVEQRYPEQHRQECDLLPEGYCYYDGSGLNAEAVYTTLLEKGSDGVWETLENYYRELFEAVPQ
jgi:hypothetical protein